MEKLRKACVLDGNFRKRIYMGGFSTYTPNQNVERQIKNLGY